MKFNDLKLFLSTLRNRISRFKNTEAKAYSQGALNNLALQLHPAKQKFIIRDIIRETPLTKTYRIYLEDSESTPSYFQAGQYISVGIEQDDTFLYRPYSISSSPEEALKKGFYDITIKNQKGGYGCAIIHKTWQIGTTLTTSAPEGLFTYNPIRDSDSIVLLAGGSGITPFKPLVNELLKSSERQITLFHGALSEKDLIFRKYFETISIENRNQIRYIPVLSEPGLSWRGESGLISLSLIRNYTSEFMQTEFETLTFFLCGPPAMISTLNNSLQEQGVPLKNIRMEKFFSLGKELKSPYKEFKMVVKIQNKTYNIPVRSNETLLDSLESAGLNPPSLCRNGHCGWCRSKLLKGSIDSHCGIIRNADRRFDYIHTCCSFPISDIVLEVPVNTIK